MVLATIFVSLPFVVREVVPVLQEIGDEQEQAAATLGATRWQVFWRITLPAIRWGIAYGVVLTTARAIGEFGAVSVVSGRIAGQTQTLTLLVEQRFQNFDLAGAYAASALLGRHRHRDAAGDDAAQAAKGPSMISVDAVTKRFGDFLALDDVSLDVHDGSLTALLGPSGSGKSTLLRVIAGLELPDAGRVVIAGEDATMRARAAARDRLRVPALRGVQAHDRARERRLRAADPQAPEGRGDRARSTSCWASSGCGGYQGRYPSQLSGGQRQRMALARALAIEPQVLLLDEPFGALDAKVRAELRAWLRRLHDEVHVTTVLVTHDQEEAMDVADRIVVLNEGRIEQTGTPRELYERPANGFVMSFLGPVARLGEELVRPHDLRVTAEPRDGALEAMVDRIVHLGFEVRAELQLADGAPLAVQLTRDDAVALELAPGDIVWVGHTVEPVPETVAA